MSSSAQTPAGSVMTAGWIVAAAQVRLWEDDHCQLHAAVGDREVVDVRPRRVFPVSSRSPFVSLMNDKGEEALLLDNPARLDRDSLAALNRALDRMYYTAVITQVYSIVETMGVSMWRVNTDRGHAAFEVVDRERHIRFLPGGRFQITDADGNRFEIPCIEDLDQRSQRLIETET